MDSENDGGLAGRCCVLGLVGAYVYLVCKLPALLKSNGLSNTRKLKPKLDGFLFPMSTKEMSSEDKALFSAMMRARSLRSKGKPSQTIEMKKTRGVRFVIKELRRGDSLLGLKSVQAAPLQLNQPEPALVVKKRGGRQPESRNKRTTKMLAIYLEFREAGAGDDVARIKTVRRLKPLPFRVKQLRESLDRAVMKYLSDGNYTEAQLRKFRNI